MSERKARTSVDRILDVIDVGLQSSDEASYGNDRGGCWSCNQLVDVDDLGACEPCRARLLSDEPAPQPAVSTAWLHDEGVWGRDLASVQVYVDRIISDAAQRYLEAYRPRWVMGGDFAEGEVFIALVGTDPTDRAQWQPLGHFGAE